MSAPTITAVVLGYDRKEFLRHAVDSVRAQTTPPNDVVVTKTFPDSRIDADLGLNVRVANTTLGETILDAAREAKGEWLAFLDDDDLWDPRKLRWVSNRLRMDDSLSYYNHGFREFRGQPPVGVPLEVGVYEGALAVPGETGMERLLRRWPGNDSSIVIRKESLLRQANHLRGITACVDTFLLWAAYLDPNRAMYVEPVPLTSVRLHDSNFSRTRLPFSQYVPRYHRAVREHEWSMTVIATMVLGTVGETKEHALARRAVSTKTWEFTRLNEMLEGAGGDVNRRRFADLTLLSPSLASFATLGLYAIHPKLAVAANYANALVRW